MPLITVKALGKKTLEQKRGLVKDITDAVVRHLGARPEAITIDIVELDRDNLAVAGKLFADE